MPVVTADGRVLRPPAGHCPVVSFTELIRESETRNNTSLLSSILSGSTNLSTFSDIGNMTRRLKCSALLTGRKGNLDALELLWAKDLAVQVANMQRLKQRRLKKQKGAKTVHFSDLPQEDVSTDSGAALGAPELPLFTGSYSLFNLSSAHDVAVSCRDTIRLMRSLVSTCCSVFLYGVGELGHVLSALAGEEGLASFCVDPSFHEAEAASLQASRPTPPPRKRATAPVASADRPEALSDEQSGDSVDTSAQKQHDEEYNFYSDGDFSASDGPGDLASDALAHESAGQYLRSLLLHDYAANTCVGFDFSSREELLKMKCVRQGVLFEVSCDPLPILLHEGAEVAGAQEYAPRFFRETLHSHLPRVLFGKTHRLIMERRSVRFSTALRSTIQAAPSAHRIVLERAYCIAYELLSQFVVLHQFDYQAHLEAAAAAVRRPQGREDSAARRVALDKSRICSDLFRNNIDMESLFSVCTPSVRAPEVVYLVFSDMARAQDVALLQHVAMVLSMAPQIRVIMTSTSVDTSALTATFKSRLNLKLLQYNSYTFLKEGQSAKNSLPFYTRALKFKQEQAVEESSRGIVRDMKAIIAHLSHNSKGRRIIQLFLEAQMLNMTDNGATRAGDRRAAAVDAVVKEDFERDLRNVQRHKSILLPVRSGVEDALPSLFHLEATLGDTAGARGAHESPVRFCIAKDGRQAFFSPILYSELTELLELFMSQ